MSYCWISTETLYILGVVVTTAVLRERGYELRYELKILEKSRTLVSASPIEDVVTDRCCLYRRAKNERNKNRTEQR